jgi:hypothetical protein
MIEQQAMRSPSSKMTRRRFVRDSAAGITLANVAPGLAADAPAAKQLRLWAIGDARRHRSAAAASRWPRPFGSRSRAARTARRPSDWDIAISVGDFSGNQRPPEDDEGAEVVRQYAAATKHRARTSTTSPPIMTPAARVSRRSGGSASGLTQLAKAENSPA